MILISKNKVKKIHPNKIKGLKIKFYGYNNSVKLYEPLPTFVNCHIDMGNNSYVEIASSKFSIKNLKIYKTRPGSVVVIGEDFSCEGVEFPMQCECNLMIKIGRDCMFSHDISLMCTDSHAIIDLSTQCPVNYGKNIEIGDHVWLAPYCMIFKGVKIANDNIIGAHSIVSKDISECHTISVGAPAKITSRNRTWNRLSAQLYRDKHKI